MKRTVNLFQIRQYMEHPDYELYFYSDKPSLNVIPHTHDFYEIYYLLSDELDYIVGNQCYHLKKGDFIILPPGLLHYPFKTSANKSGSYDRIVLWCSIPFFETLITHASELNHMWDAAKANFSYHIRPSTGSSQLLYAYLLRLLDEQAQPGFASSAMIFALVLEIFVQINRIVAGMEQFKQHSPIASLFNNILYYIHTHLTEDLSLDTLSQEFFVSKGYINKIFKEHLEIPVHKYILALRLESCKNAISQGTPINQAAEFFGFHDYSSFYRSFKKQFFMSPKEYLTHVHATAAQSKNTKVSVTSSTQSS